MGEYVFRDATGFGFDCDADVELAYGTNLTVREYYAQNNTDNFGTIHEEIVRCRDCKHAHHRPEWQPDKRFKPRDLWICTAEWCMGFEGDHPETTPDFFCKGGERR